MKIFSIKIDLRKKIALINFVFFSVMCFGQTTITENIPGDYTFSVPCDVTSITVEIWGAGGGGYGDNSNDNIVGYGGGGGGYSSATLTVSGGEIVNITIGAGGNGGGVGAGNAPRTGGDGGNSSITTLLNNLVANGGTGGGINTVGIGGTASGGIINTSGQDGNITGGISPNGYNGGNGGGTGGGIGGNGGGNGGNGNPGSIPGGGGGASGDQSGGAENGGAGADGQVVITYNTSYSTYCSSIFTVVEPITNITFAGINNTTSNTVNGTAALESFCDLATVIQGNPTNQISVKGNTDGNYTDFIRAYVDWDQNGTFGNNINEVYDLGTITNSTGNDTNALTANISVPVTATVGLTKMRIIKNYNAYVTGPCVSNTFGQAEDYCVNVIAPSPCTTPSAQPTSLFLTPSGSTVVGSFTASNPVADNYLVLRSTLSTPPTAPTDGISYTIGAVYDTNYIVVDNDTNTTFSDSGLTPLTTYYYFVYAFNSICSGGPSYLGTNPSVGNATTLTADYCEPTSDDPDALYINNVAIVGSLSDPPANASSFGTNGYQNFTALPNIAVQAQGEGLNVLAYSTGGTLLRGTWKAWVDWNVDGDFDDVGEEVYNLYGFVGSSVTFGFVIPPAQTPGNYRLRIRVNNGLNITGAIGSENFGFDFTPCDTFSTSEASPKYYGETEDYLITVIPSCSAFITDIMDGETCGSGTVNLTVAGSSGTTQYHWYDSETAGNLLATTATGTWTTPSINTTTSYWVTADNGSCESVIRTEVIAEIKPLPTLTFTQSASSICGPDIVAITAGGDTEEVFLLDEDFESGDLGLFSNINTDDNTIATDNKTKFQNQTSVLIPNTNVWFPAISSGFGNNQFALALSDALDPDYPSDPVENSLIQTTSVNSTGFLDLTLKLDFYYSRYYPAGYLPTEEYVAIELSTDNGASYPIEIDNFSENTGIGSNFTTLTYDLSAYIDQPNLKIRIRHYSFAGSGWLPDGVAVDDIKIYGTKPLNTAFDWIISADAYSDAAATIPYVSGVSTPVPTIYVKPTQTQMENNNSFTFIASAILSNGCSATQDITITNNSKVWQGFNTDWNNPNNWRPIGVPDNTSCVVIPSTPFDAEIDGATDANAYTLTVLSDGILTVFPNGTITVQDYVNVETGGTFELQGLQQDAAQLIQVNDVVNSGVIYLKRETNVRTQDYVYWSSPVENFSITNIGYSNRYYWIPTIDSNLGDYGIWQATSEIMVAGKGYIVRAPFSPESGNNPDTPTWNTVTFIGTPYNGTIIRNEIERGNHLVADGNIIQGGGLDAIEVEDDNWNLVGNPYPSALSADAFLAQNTNLDSYIKLWRHGTKISQGYGSPFYGNYIYNYNLADYLTYNYLGGTQSGFEGYIGSGQGFFVQLLDSASSAFVPTSITFNNSMRSNTYNNSQFFRLSNNDLTVERHRIWLDLVEPTGIAYSSLIGYMEGATMEIDQIYDTPYSDDFSSGIYSIANGNNFIIQGRSLPFNPNDQVSIGINVNSTGVFALAIQNIDGLFEESSQEIYINDLETGIIHNLKESPYFFTVNKAGTYDKRFILQYTNKTPGIDGLMNNNISIIAPNNEYIKVTSGTNQIESVEVFDLLGRVLIEKQKVNAPELTINNVPKANGTYIVKAILVNGTQKIQKVVLKF